MSAHVPMLYPALEAPQEVHRVKPVRVACARVRDQRGHLVTLHGPAGCRPSRNACCRMVQHTRLHGRAMSAAWQALRTRVRAAVRSGWACESRAPSVAGSVCHKRASRRRGCLWVCVGEGGGGQAAPDRARCSLLGWSGQRWAGRALRARTRRTCCTAAPLRVTRSTAPGVGGLAG